MCFSFMISMAAKCSDVWGWGHDSLPAGREGPDNSMFTCSADTPGLNGIRVKFMFVIILQGSSGSRVTIVIVYGALLTDQQEGCVHDSGSVQHGSHQNVVPRTVYKRHVSEYKRGRERERCVQLL